MQASKNKQRCAQCRARHTCWKTVVSDRATVVSLLVCRLQQGIQQNATTRLILQLLRTKLRRMARSTPGLTTTELESVAIEGLLYHYRLGSVMHPLRWLFAAHFGFISAYIIRFRQTAQRQPLYLEDIPNERMAAPTVEPKEYDDQAEIAEHCLHALDLLDDGVTFPIAEYRVLRFSLNNADECGSSASRMTNGLHQFLTRHTGASKSWVHRQYGNACRRLLEFMGRGRPVEISRSAEARRQARLERREDGVRVSSEEAREILNAKRQRRTTVADLAWSYGVSPRKIYELERRYPSHA